jgi:hypothetical protein
MHDDRKNRKRGRRGAVASVCTASRPLPSVHVTVSPRPVSCPHARERRRAGGGAGRDASSGSAAWAGGASVDEAALSAGESIRAMDRGFVEAADRGYEEAAERGYEEAGPFPGSRGRLRPPPLGLQGAGLDGAARWWSLGRSSDLSIEEP